MRKNTASEGNRYDKCVGCGNTYSQLAENDYDLGYCVRCLSDPLQRIAKTLRQLNYEVARFEKARR